jgi:hypothetical protein
VAAATVTGSVALSGSEAAAALRGVLASPSSRQGRFLRVDLPDGAASVAAVLARAAPLRALAVRRAATAQNIPPSPSAAFRLATALRQDLWRRLRSVRGLAPAVAVRLAPDGAEVTVFACFLGGAAASPVTLDVLHRIVEDAALRQSSGWAARVSPPPERSARREVP